MRHLHLSASIFLLLIASYSFSQEKTENRFFIKGIITGQDTGYIHIGYTNNRMKYIDDSCRIQSGTFEFIGYVNGAIIAKLYGNRKSRSVDDPNWMEMFIEPGTITVHIRVNEFKKAQITGSKSQSEFSVYHTRIDSLNSRWQGLFNDLNTARANHDSIKTEEIINDKLPAYKAESQTVSRTYIKEFPNSSVSAYLLLYDNTLTLDSLQYHYSTLSSAVQHSFYGSEIDSSITRQRKLQIGSLAPGFVQTDIKGHEISLQSFKGKYILLDFWASWCVPCREEHPFLKSAYVKYP